MSSRDTSKQTLSMEVTTDPPMFPKGPLSKDKFWIRDNSSKRPEFLTMQATTWRRQRRNLSPVPPEPFAITWKRQRRSSRCGKKAHNEWLLTSTLLSLRASSIRRGERWPFVKTERKLSSWPKSLKGMATKVHVRLTTRERLELNCFPSTLRSTYIQQQSRRKSRTSKRSYTSSTSTQSDERRSECMRTCTSESSRWSRNSETYRGRARLKSSSHS